MIPRRERTCSHSIQPAGSAFSPDGKRFAMGFDHTIQIWNLTTKQLELTIPTAYQSPRLAFSSDGKNRR